MITITQARAARHLLRWEQSRVAGIAGVNTSYICGWEVGYRMLDASVVARIEAAMVDAGIVFVNKPDGTTGILWKESK